MLWGGRAPERTSHAVREVALPRRARPQRQPLPRPGRASEHLAGCSCKPRLVARLTAAEGGAGGDSHLEGFGGLLRPVLFVTDLLLPAGLVRGAGELLRRPVHPPQQVARERTRRAVAAEPWVGRARQRQQPGGGGREGSAHPS